MWVRSIWMGDLIVHIGLVIRSEHSLIFVNVWSEDGRREQGWRRDVWPRAPGWSPWDRIGERWWERLGFAYAVGSTRSNQRVHQFAVPYYFIALLAGFLPALVAVRRLRERRRACTGRCLRCGYDLRATPDRCPECGKGAATASSGVLDSFERSASISLRAGSTGNSAGAGSVS